MRKGKKKGKREREKGNTVSLNEWHQERERERVLTNICACVIKRVKVNE